MQMRRWVSGIYPVMPEGFFSIEFGFCIAFVFELVARMVALKKDFFCDDEALYNWFDILIVALSLLEQVVFLLGANFGINLNYLRAARLMRLMRIFRFSTQAMMVELRQIIRTVLDSVKSIIPCGGLVAMFTFVVVLINMEVLMTVDSSQGLDDLARTCYGTSGQGLNTMVKAVTGGVLWGDLLDIHSKASGAM